MVKWGYSRTEPSINQDQSNRSAGQGYTWEQALRGEIAGKSETQGSILPCKLPCVSALVMFLGSVEVGDWA